MAYSQLSVDKDCENQPRRRFSILLIPNCVRLRTMLFFLFLCSTAILFNYSRYLSINTSRAKKLQADTIQKDTSSQQDTSKADTLQQDISQKDTLQQDTQQIDTLRGNTRKEPSKPIWTWACQGKTKQKHCVRIMTSENSTVQSLHTCNMICLKTPIWPLPTGDSYFSTSVVPIEMQGFSLNIQTSPSNEVTQYLQEAFAFMKRDIHNVGLMKQDGTAMLMHVTRNAKGLEVRVSVKSDKDPRLRLDTQEHYTLEVKQQGSKLVATITAESFCGARHGFETLSQLIWFDRSLNSVLALESAEVVDAPKFKYRGLLLDTARQYFPVEDILRTIDAMAASKLNTFHWHATDSQSFPLKLNSVPEMALYGAYSHKDVYTVQNIKTIVHRARVRGIRVVIEIDAPAHVGNAWSWGQSAGLGDLAFCIERDPWRGYCGQPPCGQLNPRNDHVYEVLEKIYKEIIELTGVGDVFHLGGDEVNLACWNEHIPADNLMNEWLKFQQKSYLALQKANKGKSPEMTIIWSSQLTEHFNSRLKNYTVQFWYGSNPGGMQILQEASIPIIVSNVEAWYFDCGLSVACRPYRKWFEVYQHRPWGSKRMDVVGGTACMWTEHVAPEVVDSILWPRGAALAERLWTDPDHGTIDVNIRMDMQRRRLVDRNIRADVIWPRWCSENMYECQTNNLRSYKSLVYIILIPFIVIAKSH